VRHLDAFPSMETSRDFITLLGSAAASLHARADEVIE
jgi:hypothetical protein